MTAQQAQAAARMLRDVIHDANQLQQRSHHVRDNNALWQLSATHLQRWQLVSLEELAELLEETTNANRS